VKHGIPTFSPIVWTQRNSLWIAIQVARRRNGGWGCPTQVGHWRHGQIRL